MRPSVLVLADGRRHFSIQRSIIGLLIMGWDDWRPTLVTFPSDEEEAILRIISWSRGSVAYWASSYSTLVRGGLVMSR